MSNSVIQIEAISHNYGKTPVLKDVNLSIEAGTIYGLLGRNGAGKSTLLRILMRLQKPSAGRCSILGQDVAELGPEQLELIGYVPEVQDLPITMSCGDLIEWSAALRPTWDLVLAAKLISEAELDLKAKIHKLSLGKQRYLSFILAAAFRPKVLICDEPTANLDPVVRRSLLNRLLELSRDSETAIIISSHQLSDLERVASHVGILAHNKLAVSAPLDDLKQEHQENLEELFISLNHANA